MNSSIDIPSRNDLPGRSRDVDEPDFERSELDLDVSFGISQNQPQTPSQQQKQQNATIADNTGSQANLARRQKKKRVGESSPPTNSYTGQMLNRWPRAIARTADLLLFMGIVLVAYTLATGSGLLDLYHKNLFGFFALIFAALPIAIALDGLVAALLGNSPAKAIVGVRATSSRGERLTVATHLRRSYGVWTDGLAMGLLPLSVATLVRQFNRVTGRREATYDERLHVRMRSGTGTGLRALLVIVLVATAATAFGMMRGAATSPPLAAPHTDPVTAPDTSAQLETESSKTAGAAIPATNAVAEPTQPAASADTTTAAGNQNAQPNEATETVNAGTTGDAEPSATIAEVQLAAVVEPQSATVTETEPLDPGSQTSSGSSVTAPTAIWSNTQTGLNIELDSAFVPADTSAAPELATFDHTTLPVRVKTYFWSSGQSLPDFLENLYPGVSFGNDALLRVDRTEINLQVGEMQDTRVFIQAANIGDTQWLITAQAPQDLTEAETFEKLDSLRLSLWSTIVP